MNNDQTGNTRSSLIAVITLIRQSYVKRDGKALISANPLSFPREQFRYVSCRAQQCCAAWLCGTGFR